MPATVLGQGQHDGMGALLGQLGSKLLQQHQKKEVQPYSSDGDASPVPGFCCVPSCARLVGQGLAVSDSGADRAVDLPGAAAMLSSRHPTFSVTLPAFALRQLEINTE